MIFISVVFLTAALLTWFCNLLELIPWRRAAGAHWTERARQLYPARVSGRLNFLSIPTGLTLLVHKLDSSLPWQAVLISGMLGALLGNFPMDRVIEPGLGFRRWLEEVLTGCLLLYTPWVVAAAAGIFMPTRFGWPLLAMAGAFLAIHFSLQFGSGLWLMRRLGLARPASPRLQVLVDETCSRLRVPVAATWQIPWGHANAAAMVTTRELVFAEKTLAACSDEQLKAICAHELGHISESRWVLWVRIAGTLQILPLIFIRPVNAWFSILAVLVPLFAFVLMMRLSQRLANRMEKRADQVARESTAETGLYARALERLYEASRTPAVQPKSSLHVHPDLYDRMVTAGVTPDYPRPAPPRKQGVSSFVFGVACVLFGVWY